MGALLSRLTRATHAPRHDDDEEEVVVEEEEESLFKADAHQEKGAPCCSHYFCMLTCRNDPFYMFNMVAKARCML